MAGGFTYMYAGLVAIFALLFFNLAVARICEVRRKNRLEGASQVCILIPLFRRLLAIMQQTCTAMTQLPYLSAALQGRPGATTRSTQNVEYALSSRLKPFAHRQVRMHEAVCITNPDG